MRPALLRRLFSVLAIGLIATVLPGITHAASATKQLHLTLTEANYDRAKGRLILTVRVQAADFESVLSERAKHKVSAADPGELAPLALEYVREKFLMKTAGGQPLRLEWAGLDVTESHIFLFFEAPLIGNIQGARITNTLLQESFPDQINSVELHDGALKQTIVFAHDTGEIAVQPKP